MEEIHDRIRQHVALDDLRVCFHTDEDDCPCRKPRPGMLVDAARDWDIDLSASFMIGDRWRDIEAGHAAGCRTLLVGQPYDERPPEGYFASVSSLLEASAVILEADKGA
ncbi:MAG: HAD-IIIA family hydrolase [Acidobacteria bacterium]|nr:HAD-IIIA family hydrolase [Acidobacteriota bacterium]